MNMAYNRDGTRNEPELKEIVENPTTPEERAQNLKDIAEFWRNAHWFGDHAQEIRDQYSGKYIVILGQELFVGDDPLEVHARASAAHPELSHTSYGRRLSTSRGPKIYANRR